METAQKIIACIQGKYPEMPEIAIRNSSDFNIETKVGIINQYVIGVTETYQFSGSGIDHYRHSMKEKLGALSENIECLPWPFSEDEIEEAKGVLKELSGYFKAELEIDEMFLKANIKKGRGVSYYLVITIIPIQMVYAN